MASTFLTDFWLPCSPEQAFALLADARNLDRVTPPWFRFHILSPQPIEMGIGTTIEYRFRWRWLVMRWRSRITTWHPSHSFEYEQAKGPFRSFRHEHQFLPEEGGVRVVDRVEFAGPAGRFLDRALVTPDLRRIFRYREAACARLVVPFENRSAPGEAAQASAAPAPSRQPRTSASSSTIEEPT